MQGKQFRTQEVQGIQQKTKTMFRDPIAGDSFTFETDYSFFEGGTRTEEYMITKYAKCKVGEIVFLQEEFVYGVNMDEETDTYECDTQGEYIFRTWYKLNNDLDVWVEDDIEVDVPWEKSSEMQEYQSRTFLKIKSVKVERLQDILATDCIQEGLNINDRYPSGLPISFKEKVWNNQEHKDPYRWEYNPYVFVYEFKEAGRP